MPPALLLLHPQSHPGLLELEAKTEDEVEQDKYSYALHALSDAQTEVCPTDCCAAQNPSRAGLTRALPLARNHCPLHTCASTQL